MGPVSETGSRSPGDNYLEMGGVCLTGHVRSHTVTAPRVCMIAALVAVSAITSRPCNNQHKPLAARVRLLRWRVEAEQVRARPIQCLGLLAPPGQKPASVSDAL